MAVEPLGLQQPQEHLSLSTSTPSAFVFALLVNLLLLVGSWTSVLSPELTSSSFREDEEEEPQQGTKLKTSGVG